MQSWTRRAKPSGAASFHPSLGKRRIRIRANGTSITVFGYNENSQIGFSHAAIKDYVLWFTKFGSFEIELGIGTISKISFFTFAGWVIQENPNGSSFGHVLPTRKQQLGCSLRSRIRFRRSDFYVADGYSQMCR